jgi:hypothetical protein
MGGQAPWGLEFCGEWGGSCEWWEGGDTPSAWPPHIYDGKSNLTSALRL